MARIVILGGGFGGAAAALAARDSGQDVVLVDRRTESYLCGVNPAVIVGAAEPVSRSIASLADAGVDFRQADITSIDLQSKTVGTSRGLLDFDYLIIALGVVYDWDAVPGSRDAHSFYDHESAARLRHALDEFDGGSIVIGIGGTPYRCPPAPFEAALMIDSAMRARGTRNGTNVTVAIPEPAPVGVAGPAASGRIRDILERHDIELLTELRATGASSDSITFSDGSTRAADVPIVVPTHRLPPTVADTGLAGETAFVPVDRHSLETQVDGVFAVGDVNTIPLGEKAGIPKAGVFAAGQGRHVARVIAHRLGDGEDPGPYDGVGHCFMMLGPESGARIGGDFYATGGPAVDLEEPSPAGRRAKDEWERAWAGFEI